MLQEAVTRAVSAATDASRRPIVGPIVQKKTPLAPGRATVLSIGPQGQIGKKRLKRPSILPRGQRFATEEIRQEAKKTAEVALLAAQMPKQLVVACIGGELAAKQVPDETEQRKLCASVLYRRAGREGGALYNPMKALEVIIQEGKRIEAPGGMALPLSAARAHQLIAEAQRLGEEKGHKWCGHALRDGFKWLVKRMKLQIEIDEDLFESAAPNPSKSKEKRAMAGTLDIKCRLQIEEKAASIQPATPLRFVARSLLAYGWDNSIRVQDMATISPVRDHLEPGKVIAGSVKISKDGAPLSVAAYPEGISGAYDWFEEHEQECIDRGTAFPAWVKPWGSGGKISKSKELTADKAATKAEIRNALEDILMQEPLGLSTEEIKALAIKGHSVHGTPADWARMIGAWPAQPAQEEDSSPCPGFEEGDIRALGWWLRDQNAPEEDDTDKEAQSTAKRRKRGGNMKHMMQIRYTEGEERVGVRAQQLRIRRRLYNWARGCLQAWIKHWGIESWTQLPKGRADLMIMSGGIETTIPQPIEEVKTAKLLLM